MYDCTKCGACCIDQLIVVVPTDKVPILMTDGPVMRRQTDRCIALRGRLGIDTTCTIYDQRPEICKFMKSGSGACKEMRIAWGLST